MTDLYGAGGDETRLYKEASYAVAPGVIAYKRMNGLGIDIAPSVVTNIRRVPGAMIGSTSTRDDDFTVGTFEGAIDYNALGAIFDSLYGYSPVSDLGGSPNAYSRTWSWDGRRPKRAVSYALSSGYPDRARFANGAIFNSLSLDGSRPDGFNVSGNIFARACTEDNLLGGVVREVQTITVSGTVSGGDYTITIVETGETTATIAHNANIATIQAALDALGSIESGDIIVGGGSLPGTPVTITYDGPNFAGRNIAQLTVDSSALTGGGSYAVTTTTPGSDTVTDITPVPAGAVDASLFVDSSWGALGTTRALRVLAHSFNIPERFVRVMPTNKLLTSDGRIENEDQTGHTLAMMYALNDDQEAQITRLRASDRVFVRQEFESGLISGSNNYRLRIDTCLLWETFGNNTSQNSVQANELSGQLVIDGSNAITIELINAVAAY